MLTLFSKVAVKYGQDPRMYNIMCKEFIGDENGNVTGVRAVEISWVKVSYNSINKPRICNIVSDLCLHVRAEEAMQFRIFYFLFECRIYH